MIARRWRVRWIKAMGYLLVLLAVAVVFLPYGFGRLARPIARRYGVRWEQHQRDGRRYLELRGLEVSQRRVWLTADRVQVMMPMAWIKAMVLSSSEPLLAASGWRLTILDAPDDPSPDRETVAVDWLARVGKIWNHVYRWMPLASLQDGKLEWPQHDLALHFPALEWTPGGGRLDAHWAPETGQGSLHAEIDAYVNWPSSGRVSLHLRQHGELTSQQLPFMKGSQEIDLTDGELSFQGDWNRGPVRFRLDVAQGITLMDDLALSGTLALRGDGHGINGKQRTLSALGLPLLEAEGHMALALYPGNQPGKRWVWDDAAPLHLRAKTLPADAFWNSLGEALPAWPRNPHLAVRIEGTGANPLGQITMRADRIDSPLVHPNGEPLPTVSDIDAIINLRGQALVLDRLFMRVAGQGVTFKARWPLSLEAWEALAKHRQWPHWSELEGSVSIASARVDAFRPWLPSKLAPTGTFSADVEFQPGGYVFGSVTLRDAASRPLLPIGTLSSLHGDITFDGRRVKVERMSARLGDRDVMLTAEAALSDAMHLDYAVFLAGKALPLVRRPGLLLRGDIDLHVQGSTSPGATTRVGGQVGLMNGYFLSDLRLPEPGSVTVPEQRPPFFHIDQPPFHDWELDVAIHGHRFMQVRSPMFSGVLSLDLHLGGTLGEPVAPGSITVDSGFLRFPFGTLMVERGRVFMTPENPFTMGLDFVSAGRVFGYDIQLQVQGSTEDPMVEFSSTPPLGSDAILLMMTAGQLPQRELEFTGPQRAARLALFLGQNLLYELTGDETIGDRLMIESGRNISASGRETYAIRYRLHERLYLTGEYDEFDAINAGIKWRLFSR